MVWKHLILLLVAAVFHVLIVKTSFVGRSKKEKQAVSRILWILVLTSIIVDLLFP